MHSISTNFKAAPKLPFYIGLIFGVFLIGLAAKELLAVTSAAILAEQDAQLERDWDFKVHLKNVDILLKDAEMRAGEHAAQDGGASRSQMKAGGEAVRSEAEFRALAALQEDDAIQKANLEKLHALITRRLLALGDAAGDVREGLSTTAAAQTGQAADAAGDLLALRKLGDAIDARQSILIADREEQIREHYWATLMACFAGSVIFMALLVLFYRANQRYFTQLKRSKRELESKNDHLKNDIALRAEQLTALSHHLLAVSEQEKASLARELHDELGSNLTALRLDLLVVLEKLKPGNAGMIEDLHKTLDLLKKTHDIKRRIVENLHPGMLEKFGLAATVRAYGDEVAQRTGLHIDVDMDDGAAGIDPERAIAMYRIVQESLTNAVKYAKAKHVAISLTRESGGLRLRIADDGIGLPKGVLGKTRSHGIVGMRERATLLGGTFRIDSDRGTRIDVFVPCRY